MVEAFAIQMVHYTTGVSAFSTCEDIVVSEAASSMVRFETSPLRDEISSSPLTDGAGDASGVVVLYPLAGEGAKDASGVVVLYPLAGEGIGDASRVVVLRPLAGEGTGDASGEVVLWSLVGEGKGDDSASSTCCCRLQYIMLAVRVRIIF